MENGFFRYRFFNIGPISQNFDSSKKLSPHFISGIEGIEHLGDQSGALIIGDKCFTLASGFRWCMI